MMLAPADTANADATADATSRSGGSLCPVTSPRKVFREGPTSRGAWRRAPFRPRLTRGSPLISCRLPSDPLANPRPGSSRMRQGWMPAAMAASPWACSSAPTSVATSPYAVFSGSTMVVGSPRMCISTYGTPSSATWRCMSGSRVPPDTSLTRWAPRATAALATSAWKVSTAISTSRNAASLASAPMTGMMRCSSTSGGRRAAWGRVDWPPTSMMSTPASTICRACSTAASTSR
mmetsp:Transcript_10118/g.30289  ORF Transcript_10118/g.30289 Transcript_10118/m.30289 type:complete len:234 (-) Transcript_10118:1074-1775(-)